jgi:hypothetical protein
VTVTTTRCPRCGRALLGDREVPVPVHFLPGGKADQARRAYLRKHGRPAPLRELPRHDATACDRYLARVLRDCHGHVLCDGVPVGTGDAFRLEMALAASA